MTTLQIATAVLLVWIIAGVVTVRFAERAGQTFGWFPGDGWGCRAWVLLQAPGAIVDTMMSDVIRFIRYGDEPLTPAHAYILWAIFIDPKLDPDTALHRRDGKP
jgi:hypothetical protein